MFGYHITVISPYIFQIYDELIRSLVVVRRKHNRLFAKNFLDINSTLCKNSTEDTVSNFCLDKISTIKAIDTVGPNDPILKINNLFISDILNIVLKKVIDRHYLLDEMVRSLKFLSFTCKMKIIVFIADEVQVILFYKLLIVQDQL